MRRIALVAATAMAASSAPAEAQISFGPQLSLGTDSDLGLGARLVFPLRTEALGLDGVIDGNYFFPGDNLDWLEANLNARLPIPIAQDFDIRIGAGLNLTFISVDSGVSVSTDTHTEVGLNLLGGIEFPQGTFTPFGELRVIVGGGEQVVITAGFTLGSRGTQQDP